MFGIARDEHRQLAGRVDKIAECLHEVAKLNKRNHDDMVRLAELIKEGGELQNDTRHFLIDMIKTLTSRVEDLEKRAVYFEGGGDGG